jgi:N-sulfoglucosamine sulfohydrolase
VSSDFSRRQVVKGGVVAAGLAAAAVTSSATASAPAYAGQKTKHYRRPNILLFTIDDLALETLGFFGGRRGITPNIDRLASQSTVFGRAHVPLAVCQPSRSALMTGLYPHRNGAEGFGPIDDGVPVLNDILKQQDYLTGILSKVEHLQPFERFGWDLALYQEDLGQGRNPAKYAAAAKDFFERSKDEDRPFFLMANSNDPHRPFFGSKEEKTQFTPEELATTATPSAVYTADTVKVPGFLPDLPDVRTELAQYESSARRADDTIGAVLAELKEARLDDDTIVVFFSDNGMALPFSKANAYVQSTHTPLMVRWPGVARPGRVDKQHFVCTIDLFPTLALAAGGKLPDDLDGRDLTSLLEGRHQRDRDEIHTVFHETSAKQRFEMRAVSDDRWSYIWNPWSDGVITYKNESMNGLTWPAMVAAAQTDPEVAARVDMFLHRVPEELYDLRQDPDSLVNLAPAPGEEPAHSVRSVLRRLRASTEEWMVEKADPLHDRYVAEVPQAS